MMTPWSEVCEVAAAAKRRLPRTGEPGYPLIFESYGAAFGGRASACFGKAESLPRGSMTPIDADGAVDALDVDHRASSAYGPRQ